MHLAFGDSDVGVSFGFVPLLKRRHREPFLRFKCEGSVFFAR